MPQKYDWANSDEKNALRKVLKVSEIILHPDFNTAKASNDIALVRVIFLISYIPIINTTFTSVRNILIVRLNWELTSI